MNKNIPKIKEMKVGDVFKTRAGFKFTVAVVTEDVILCARHNSTTVSYYNQEGLNNYFLCMVKPPTPQEKAAKKLLEEAGYKVTK